ncbi:sensor histidine kinase [Tropicibacter naphthalenivorans]|uniref:histidine kinase n=1 Tax=Tropicibacter naphthalenivorans TaxID=441103 RepID=A0A0P1G2D2_9RHOB|nr:ATP-binding protein [Tropicibacter naphthalenivorans]CUH75939.1 Sensor protein ZraS [Tropicibacter naphthalenivorans]SMC41127.1 PAS domain S-box-containing protein [Tropicibacter naphthalenivorans]
MSTADMDPQIGGLGDQAWADVLEAMDRTYAELVDYQEQLETRNAELTTLRNFLSSIMVSISDYLVVADREGHIADASGSFCAVLGLEVEDLSGRAIRDFVAEDHRAQLMQAVREAIASRAEVTVAVDVIGLHGRDPVEFRIAPRLDRRRKATGVVLTGRPLGELMRAYAELNRSHEELKAAQGQLVRNEKLASLGRLLAGVAHELNNPISFVYANTHTLEKYLGRFESYFDRVQAGASREELVALRQELKLDRNLKNFGQAIKGARDGAERVRDIVEDLRRLSADGSGEVTRFDLAEIARVAANWIERGTKAALDITYSGEDRLEVMGRPGHIQQVLMNLIQNAVDAMDGQDTRTICIHCSYDGDCAVLELCDSGPGIDDDTARAIFDPFFTTKDVGKGTGLGLSISYKIIEEHGGKLELLTKRGPGACFQIRLPRGEAR